MTKTILGIDYGSKRIGVAIAEEGQPRRLTTLLNTELVMDELKGLIEHHKVEAIVVGLPRSLDGDETQQTAVVRSFASKLSEALPSTEICLQDEALTSELASKRLRAEGKLKPELLDSEAAVVILEDYVREN